MRRMPHSTDLQAEAGAFARARSGGRVAYSGLHANSTIRADQFRGAVSVLLSAPGALEPTYLVTAGHLFRPRSDGRRGKVFAASGEQHPEIFVGSLLLNLLDTPQAAPGDEVPGEWPRDAALVKLTRLGRQLARWTAHRGRPPGIRQAIVDSLSAELPVCTMSRSSRRTGISAVPERHIGVISITDRLRGRVSIVHPILTPDMGVRGDSGGLLHSVEEPRTAVGSYVGRSGNQSVFESMGGLLRAFENQQRTELTIWTTN